MVTRDNGIFQGARSAEPPERLTSGAPTLLLNPGKSRRALPVNLREGELELFESQLEYPIPATELLKLESVRVNYEGLLFRRATILSESYVSTLPAERRGRLNTRFGFLAKNYLRRKTIDLHGVGVWFVNNWSNNYFHWMTDAIPRLCAAGSFLGGATVLLPGGFKRFGYILSSLQAFGKLDVRFVPADKVFRVKTLLLPTETAITGNYNDELIQRVRERYTNYYRDRHSSVGESNRIYVSRAKARARKILNEDGVISLLKEYGFETVYFEELSFDEQAVISLNAKYLVSNHGAGLTNMLFMSEGNSVLELRQRGDRQNNCYFSLASALGLNYFYQTCSSPNPEEDAHSANLIVDLPNLRKNVELMLSHGCTRSSGFHRESMSR